MAEWSEEGCGGVGGRAMKRKFVISFLGKSLEVVQSQHEKGSEDFEMRKLTENFPTPEQLTFFLALISLPLEKLMTMNLKF